MYPLTCTKFKESLLFTKEVGFEERFFQLIYLSKKNVIEFLLSIKLKKNTTAKKMDTKISNKTGKGLL